MLLPSSPSVAFFRLRMSFSHLFRWLAKSPASRSMASFLVLLVETKAFSVVMCHFCFDCEPASDKSQAWLS